MGHVPPSSPVGDLDDMISDPGNKRRPRGPSPLVKLMANAMNFKAAIERAESLLASSAAPEVAVTEFRPVVEHTFTFTPEVNAAMALSRETGMDVEQAFRVVQAATQEYRPISEFGPPGEPPIKDTGSLRPSYNGPGSRRIILGD